MSPAEAIAVIHNAGGLAVLAHPGIGNVSRFIDDLVPLGLDGIEIYHPIAAPLHALTGEKVMDFPQSERLSKKLFSLPIYPTLTKKEIEKIARSLSGFL
jgi:dTDP-4-amino-4,6-dideoxygalactose transaminase